MKVKKGACTENSINMESPVMDRNQNSNEQPPLLFDLTALGS
jgi:hypothetical protein